MLDEEGNHVVDQEAFADREALRDSLTDVALPGNPIDLLIEHFHAKGLEVAELTGRSECIETDDTGKKVLRPRKIEGYAMSKRAIGEMAAFQSGQKRIAIISDSGGGASRCTPIYARRTSNSAFTSL